VTLFPDEIGFVLLGSFLLPTLALASLARSTASAFAASHSRVISAATSHDVQDMVIDVLDDVENAQLVLGVRPDLGQNFGIKIRAIGHHHQGQKTMLFEIVQETPHVVLIIGTNQGEGHGEIVERVGSQEQRAMAKMNFIDTERSGELLQSPLAILGHVHLPDFPVEAIVEEPVGQFEMEIPLQGFLKASHAHLVVEQTVEDSLTNPVGVLSPQFDSLDLARKVLQQEQCARYSPTVSTMIRISP
jgi:hypothetical protein